MVIKVRAYFPTLCRGIILVSLAGTTGQSPGNESDFFLSIFLSFPRTMFVAIRPVSRGVLTRQAIRRLAAVRGFCSEGKGEDKKSEGEQKENTSKDVGNPISNIFRNSLVSSGRFSNENRISSVRNHTRRSWTELDYSELSELIREGVYRRDEVSLAESISEEFSAVRQASMEFRNRF